MEIKWIRVKLCYIIQTMSRICSRFSTAVGYFSLYFVHPVNSWGKKCLMLILAVNLSAEVLAPITVLV